MNFLLGYLKLQEETEIPQEFSLWSSISGVSCALGRNVWLDQGAYVLFPNFYVLLLAGSGYLHKSTAINEVARMLSKVEPPLNIIRQKITPEALIEYMRVPRPDPEKKLDAEVNQGFIIAGEFSSFLNRRSYDQGLGVMVTDLYDCDDVFEYRTKARGIERISNVWCGILGASTLDWFKESMPASAIGGGLTSRMILVYVDRKPDPIAWIEFGPEKRKLREDLVKELQKLTLIHGAFTLTPDARKLHEEEYKSFHGSSELYHSKISQGYAGRRDKHLLKIAMVLSCVEGDTLVINESHITGAYSILKKTEEDLVRVLRLVTATDKGMASIDIAEIIQEHRSITQSDLLRKVSHRMDAKEMRDVLATLEMESKIRVNLSGRNTQYEWV